MKDLATEKRRFEKRLKQLKSRYGFNDDIQTGGRERALRGVETRNRKREETK